MSGRLGAWVRVVVTAGILYAIFTKIRLTEVLAAFGDARAGYVLLGLFLSLVVRVGSALQTKLLTDAQGLSLSTRQIFDISCVSTLYGFALPMGTLAGGAVRWHRLARQDRKPAQSLVAMVFDRLIDMGVLVLGGLVFWSLDRPSASQQSVGFTLAALLFGLLLLTALMLEPRMASGVRLWVVEWPLWPEWIRAKLRKLHEAVVRYHALPTATVLQLLGLSVAQHLTGIASAFYLARALGLQLSFLNVGWVRSVLQLVSMVPISFSGLGIREASAVVVLAPYGVAAPRVVAWSLLSFVKTLLFAAIGGVVELRDRGNEWCRRARDLPPFPAGPD